MADRHANVDPAGTMTVSGIVRIYGGPIVIRNGKHAMALNGEPASGQTVMARRGASEVRRTTTDPHGRFVLRLPPGDWALQACGPVVHVTPATATRSVTLSCDVP